MVVLNKQSEDTHGKRRDKKYQTTVFKIVNISKEKAKIPEIQEEVR